LCSIILQYARSDPDYPEGDAVVTDFDIFLSYNSADKALVESVAQKLQTEGLKPWLDKWCLVPGQSWQQELATILRSCPTFGVFVGQNGLGDWAREELLVAQDRAAKERSFRLIPILLPGVPDPFDYGKLPPFLTQRTWVDFRRGLDQPRSLRTLINAIKGLPPGSNVAPPGGMQQCPYRGLETFDEEHAEFFFGRERDIQRLLEKLKATRFVAVLGASGSGKSSLTRAGLIPALKQGALPQSANWTICVLTPGSRPLTTLAAHLMHLCPSQQMMQSTLDHLIEDQRTLYLAVALSLVNKKTSRIAFLIDQFEEVFTLCSDERERAQFLANLLYASSVPEGQCTVLLTMRADFLPKCAAFPDLATRVAAHQFLVSPMNADMLRQAIEEPARRVGLGFEPGLVDKILNDVAHQPGALPLLEHALLELWKRRQGGTMTLDGYLESGGVAGAIAKTAEETFNSFNPDEQRIVRRIMLRLTQLGEGTEDTRRHASIDELATAPEEADVVERIVRAMVDVHLLTTSGV
jgi:energy-coupling factor transporter ATP-binding protein EcfA2